MYRRILVPLDGSKKSEQALPLACQLALAEGAEVVLLVAIHLGQVLFVERQDRLPTNFEQLSQQQHEEAGLYLSEHRKELEQRGLKVEVVLCSGDPRDSILEESRQRQVDLIVMTSAGKGNWMRWLSGSIADQVLRSAPCPVLVVRPPTASA